MYQCFIGLISSISNSPLFLLIDNASGEIKYNYVIAESIFASNNGYLGGAISLISKKSY